MTFRFGYTEAAILVGVTFLVLAMVFLPDYDRPPLEDVQNGYRGTGMAQIYNPRRVEVSLEENGLPDLTLPPLSTAGPRAADAYQNVQVLGDLSAAQFLRLMTAITAWVSPEEGCAYCHVGNNFATDEPYTKRVSRWMIHMVRDLNNDWANHTQGAWDGELNLGGVNCWTCHRGNNVPEYVWFEDPSVVDAMGLVGYRAGQNRPSEQAQLASLPDAFGVHLYEEDDSTLDIRVQSDIALPMANRSSIKQTELTYSLMMHMSGALGVNCTYCHNSRNWSSWEESTPQRTTAWYGIQMSQHLNSDYILPSAVALPPHRLGPLGDPAQVNCTTCHQNVYKPLYGANMIEEYPGLAYANYVDRETLEPGLGDWELSMEIGQRINEEGLAAQSEAAQAAAGEQEAAQTEAEPAAAEPAAETTAEPAAEAAPAAEAEGDAAAEEPAAPQPAEPAAEEPEAAPAPEATTDEAAEAPEAEAEATGANVTVVEPEQEADVIIVPPDEEAPAEEAPAEEAPSEAAEETPAEEAPAEAEPAAEAEAEAPASQ